MTTPIGPIAASDVNIEIGRASNTSFSMDDSVIRQLAGIPSGSISFDNLRGKSLSSTDLRAATYSSIELDDIATSGIIMTSAGEVYSFTNYNQVFQYNWLTGSTDGSQFEVYVTPLFGAGLSGSLNQWVNLATNRTWAIFSGTFENEVLFQLQLRRVGSTTILNTAEVTLYARRITRGDIGI